MDRVLTTLIDVCAVPGRLAGWLVIMLVVFVCVTVAMAQFGWNNLAEWDSEVFLLGGGITANTLTDLQWSAFALMVLFGGAFALRDDAHVSVDVLSAQFSPRWRMIARTFGDVVFLLPFCAVVVWYGVRYAQTSFASGEASTYGGLTDRWLVKAAIPAGFALLGIAGLARAVRSILRLARGADDRADGTVEPKAPS